MRAAFRRLTLILLLASGLVVVGQEPRPANLRGDMVWGGQPIELTLSWRFNPGDDPRFASPALTDSAWEIADPRLAPAGRPRSWRGGGWFRRHVTLDDALRSGPLTVRLEARGDAELFVDGRPVLRLVRGNDAQRSSSHELWSVSRAIQFERAAKHVFAVRYDCPCESGTNPIGFSVILERPGSAEVRRVTEKVHAAMYASFVAIPAVLALLHLALYWFYPKGRENLYSAFCFIAFTAIVASAFADDLVDGGPLDEWIARINYVAVVAAVFAGLLTYYAMRSPAMPRRWKYFGLAALIVAVVGAFLPETAGSVLWVSYFLATAFEMVRVWRSSQRVEREGGGVMFTGMLLLYAAITYQIAIIFELVAPPWGFRDPYLLGVLSFAVATSLFIARNFAGTNNSLERKLAEVDALTKQMIETERESARKSSEIESARILQRAILPAAPPALPWLDVAARVDTATEVGGDYYDFRIDGATSVLAAVGDAAGHGVAAGAMVTAVKALFASVAAQRLDDGLAQCDRVLRRMNVPRLHMCLLLARIEPRSVHVASAAMPPLLLRRARDGQVIELGAGGLPLGSALRGGWQEASASLEPEDVILCASDGLAETTDATGTTLGFDAVASALRDAKGQSAEAILSDVVGAATQWRSGSTQTDDIAIVVARITG